MPAVQLGFAELPEDGPLSFSIGDFPDKIGGRPFWLNPQHAAKAEDVTCGVCEKTMALLLQFYTPEDESEAYHRVLYLFCCRNGACHRTRWKDCFKAFRSQLAEFNPYYNPAEGEAPYSAECTYAAVDNLLQLPALTDIIARLCQLCGLDGSKQCARCKSASYCSREHQILDWTQGPHKEICAATAAGTSVTPTRKTPTVFFPEFELVSEEEQGYEISATENEGSEHEDDDDITGPTLTDNVTNIKIDEADVNEDIEETEVDVDKAFLRFQKRILKEPEQVVRYARVSYADGPHPEPLWVSDNGKITQSEIPSCPHCNGPRVFEFQVMPQLLNVLEINHYAADALDWGTVAVYSCISNCQPSDERAYVEEFVWRQMFSEHGMGDSAKAAMARDAALKKVTAQKSTTSDRPSGGEDSPAENESSAAGNPPTATE
ncbi:Programmed cell death protein 2 [Geranomyces michiganensis]|nr:Programmed cell death protein 2 [Geranomyces michiganensis]